MPPDELNERLKSAVSGMVTPAYLEARVRNRIRAESRLRWTRTLVLASAAAAVCSGAGIAWQRGHLRMTAGSQEAYISGVSNRVASLMRVGLGDHIHCSVFRKYPKSPPAAEEFVAKLGPQYAGLIPIVRDRISADYRMVIAHQCRYHERRFMHLSLMNGSHLVSLAITLRNKGESFDTLGMLPALAESGIPIYESGVQRFQISAFETRDHLVYFVSDLPKDANEKMILALATPVREFLKTQEL
jgi:hypothetical protein